MIDKLKAFDSGHSLYRKIKPFFGKVFLVISLYSG